MFLVVVNAQNECSDTVYKPLGDLAKRSPTYVQDSVPLCDRYLAPGWYGASHYDMPTTAPDLWECGTTYPVWLNGNIIVVLMLIYPHSFFSDLLVFKQIMITTTT